MKIEVLDGKTYADAVLPTSFKSDLYQVYVTDCISNSVTAAYDTSLSWSMKASSLSIVRVVSYTNDVGRVTAFAIGK